MSEAPVCTHDDADKAPCPICERDAEIARLQGTIAQMFARSLSDGCAQTADHDRLATENARLEHTLDTIDGEALELTGPWPPGTCAWEAAIALPDEYRKVQADRDRLAAENERLRAGIEQEAAYCVEWARHHERGNDSVSDAARAFRHRERAARLRALLQDG